jgi:DNA-binding transcriptional MerR regulator
MDAASYSIREIARELNLPESTIRYYRDAFEAYLPSFGAGRRRRYPPEAVEILRIVADGYSRNQSRDAIASRIQEMAPAVPVPTVRRISRPLPAMPADDIMATMLQDERERRDIMWQMAREIVRMGERLERQQMMLGEIARRLEATADRTLGSGNGQWLAVPPAGGTSASAREVEQQLAGELQNLREELERERELVERLRRSKLEIERRATQAENALREGGPRE